MKTTKAIFKIMAFNGALFALSSVAHANPQNIASYSVALTAVQAPNTGAASFPGAADLQQSVQINGSPNIPVPVQTGGGADTGPNYDGYGYANGSAFARAAAGVLKVSAAAEAQVVGQSSTNVGASAKAQSTAQFNDSVSFTAAGSSSQLIVTGSLLLDGTLNATGGYASITVGGTGLGSRFGAEWVGDSSGQQKSAKGVYSSWTPGTDVIIPFTFTVNNGQATELSFYLKGLAEASASFGTCPSTGGLCDVVQQAVRTANLDYSHSLVWGGVTVTDIYGTPVSFTTSSTSGFNYAAAYTPAVPVPAAAWLFGSGLLGLAGVARRKQ